MTTLEKRIMKLGESDGFRYIGFKPPLTAEELEGIPLPSDEKFEDLWRPTSRESFANGSMDLGFDVTPFHIGETFEKYAMRVAEYLGNCSLDSTVRYIGPGSVISQANGARAQY